MNDPRVAAADHAAAHMDRIYRTQRHIYDLTRRWYLLGRDELLDGLDPPDGGTILEIGCGTGRNLIAAARRHRHTSLYGFDISGAMLETAARNVHAAGLAGRLRLAEADAARFDLQRMFGIGTADRVFISYALSMIPPWRAALDRAWAHVAPGGSLHLVDFGAQERLPDAFRRLLYAWLRQFSVTPRLELRAVLEEMAQGSNGATLELKSLHRGYAWHAVLRRP